MTNACSCGWHLDPEKHKRLHLTTCAERMRWVLDAITDILDGHEWSGETCQDIAYVLIANGYEIRDVTEVD